MSITNYGELRQSFRNWVHRTDLDPVFPDFVALFEAFANRVLRLRSMQKTATLSFVDGVAQLPADFLEAVTVGTDDRNSTFLTQLQSTGAWQGSYTIDGGNIVQTGGGNGTQTIRYYSRFALGTLDGSTNAVLVDAPDAYLFGVLAEAAPYMVDDPRVALWQTKRDAALGSLQQKDDEAKFSGQTLTISTPR